MRIYVLSLLCFNIVCSISAQTIGSDTEMIEEELIEVPYNEIKTDENTIWQFKVNGKIGFKVNKTIVVQPTYDEVNYLSKESFIVKKDGYFGTIDKDFNVVIPIKYDKIEKKYYGNFILLTKNGKQGVVASNGKKIISTKYNKILYCNPENKMALIEEADGQVFFLYKNEKKLKSQLTNVVVYKNLIIAQVEGKYGILGPKGIALPFEFDAVSVNNTNNRRSNNNISFNKSNYNADNLVVKKDDKFGIIGSDLNYILPITYDQIQYDSARHLYKLIKDNKKGIYFKTSKTLLPAIYDQTYTDGSRFVIITKNNKKGAINYSAEWVLALEYDTINIHGFSKSFKVSKNKKVGWYNDEGKVIIPLLYDAMDDFYQSGFNNFYEVKIEENKGVIDKSGNTIVPVAFDYVFPKSNFFIVIKDKKMGLYSKEGKLLQPVKFNIIDETNTNPSNLLYGIKDHTILFLNKNTGEQLFNQTFKDYGYLHNEDLLINPFNENGKTYLLVKNEKDNYGIIDETKLTINVPLTYDAITQKLETQNTTYFIAKKGKTFGIIDDKNTTIIPFEYQFIEFAFINSYNTNSINFVVKRNNKFGVINLKGETLITLKYDDLSKISSHNLFKAKKGNYYKLVNSRDDTLNEGPFDQIANFESNEAQTFYNGKMRVIDKNGTFLVPAVAMQPHEGFKTFDVLKQELIAALNNTDDEALLVFATKIAPTQHLLRYVSKNIFNDKPLGHINTEYAIKRYYQMLLEFKYRNWNDERFYNKKILTNVDDYTSFKNYYSHSIVTNYRASDPSYGSTNLERLLRRSIKINGYWISSFFMDRRFYKN